MMKPFSSILFFTFLIPLTTALCTYPDVTFNSILKPISIAVSVPGNDVLNNRFITFTPSGGGDQHLYLSPSGLPISNFTLSASTWSFTSGTSTIRAVVSGQFEQDGTTKIFFTGRNQKLASLIAQFRCSPENEDVVQTVLTLKDGASTCVRSASGGRYELRYKPAGVVADGCVDVKLVAGCEGAGPNEGCV